VKRGATIAVVMVMLAMAAPAEARWQPRPTTAPWQIQLQGRIDLSVAAHVFEIDGFDTPRRTVAALHRRGRRAVCYISAGSWENYRPDADRFPAAVLGKRYDGYPDERWLDIRRIRLLAPILKRRFAMCARKGFDAVEADNVAGWENDTGFPLTAADQLRFNRWLARAVHRRGMAVGLKNDGRQAARLANVFDFAVVEECFQFNECGQYRPFTRRGKAVFSVEYELAPRRFCSAARDLRFSSIRKAYALRARPWTPCR
jgi:hypothetical protein